MADNRTHKSKSDEAVKSSKRVLDPIDRVSEALLGLIMVLTLTGSLRVAEAGRDDVRDAHRSGRMQSGLGYH